LEYTVPEEIKTEVDLFPVKIMYKTVAMIGFKGRFETNFTIPDYLGLGKAASQGYGPVKRLNLEEKKADV